VVQLIQALSFLHHWKREIGKSIMSISDEIASQVFGLPASERYELAQRLLDSIDETAADQFDAGFLGELIRRREDMIRGEHIVPDWRSALAEIKESVSK
jgi:hypothetical protein